MFGQGLVSLLSMGSEEVIMPKFKLCLESSVSEPENVSSLRLQPPLNSQPSAGNMQEYKDWSLPGNGSCNQFYVVSLAVEVLSSEKSESCSAETTETVVA